MEAIEEGLWYECTVQSCRRDEEGQWLVTVKWANKEFAQYNKNEYDMKIFRPVLQEVSSPVKAKTPVKGRTRRSQGPSDQAVGEIWTRQLKKVI